MWKTFYNSVVIVTNLFVPLQRIFIWYDMKKDGRKNNGANLDRVRPKFTPEQAREAQAKGVEARWCYATMRSMLTAKLDELDAEGHSRRERIMDKLLNQAESGDQDAIELVARLAKE